MTKNLMNKIAFYRFKGFFNFRKPILGFAGALLLLLCPGIAFSWSSVIIDKATKRPIGGAVIARSWDKYYLTVDGTRSTLYTYNEAISDEKGKFYLLPKTIAVGIPGIYGIMENRPIVYKPGYKFLILEKKISRIELEKVSTVLDLRKKEIENARYSELDYYETNLLQEMIEREEDFIERRSVRPATYEELSGEAVSKPFDFTPYLHQERVGIGKGTPMTPMAPMSPPPLGKKQMDAPVRKIQGSESIDQLIPLLGDEDWRIQNLAEKALVEKGSLAANPLIKALQHENSGVRSGAARTLGKLKDERAVKPLLFALRDNDRMVRINAAEALGEIQDSLALEPLIRALEDEDWQVRGIAAEALGKFKNPIATQVLMIALDDKAAFVRRKAAWALGEIKDPSSIQSLIKTMGDEDFFIPGQSVQALSEKALIQIGTPSLEPLIVSMKKDHYRVRRGAAHALGKIGDRRAVGPLIEALRDEHLEVRKNAAQALGEIQDPVAVVPLIVALEERALFGSAAEALLRIKDPSAIDPLSKLLNSDNRLFRMTAVKALGGIRDRKAAEKLIPVLKDEDSLTRYIAQRSLVEIGTPSVEPLIIALQDRSPEVRIGAALPLRVINDPRAVEPLIASLKDASPEVRKSASYAVGRFKDPRSIEPLIALWDDKDSKVRLEAAEVLAGMGPMAVDPLKNTLKNNNSYFRWRAASVLGIIKDPKAVDPTIHLLKDEVSEVRWTAAEALGEIKDQRAVKSLIDLLEDDDLGIRAIAAKSLAGITGENLGQDYQSWTKWWVERRELRKQ
jgi:HEAT repeat protein